MINTRHNTDIIDIEVRVISTVMKDRAETRAERTYSVQEMRVSEATITVVEWQRSGFDALL
ncbi:hypothetical protein TSUD_321970 [Trifolium subterraneum]|uniref:Uncharacterized protein n=1 Tax=Trifolium subterraneum TaxID=3900 RepID=A0A2Z6MUY7_TRISU|nr:hypothetical protein TSUD_321970 [Trifolium subterraneum]